jgi:SAM-dependent methyltransferase
MSSDERWIAAVWPFVRSQLPAAPARVVEIGCGPLGGFVPALRAAGYDATGVDPEAPEGPEYVRAEFERSGVTGPAGAVVACTSLHHVADLGEVLDLVAETLAPGGRLVVVEWARERFDEATARWCFARLPAGWEEHIRDEHSGGEHTAGEHSAAEHGGGQHGGHEHGGHEHNWLAERYAQWRESGQPWDACCRSWAEAEGMHEGQDMVRELTARFGPGPLSYGPYFFAELAGVSEADEQAAIDRGEIQANRIQYVGRR